MKVHNTFRRIALTLCICLSASLAQAATPYGLTGIFDVVAGATPQKGDFSFAVNATQFERFYEAWNYERLDGLDFIPNSDVTVRDVTFSFGLGLNERVEIGMYATQTFLEWKMETPAMFFPQETTESGLSYFGAAMKYNFLRNEPTRSYLSGYVIGNFPIGDEFKGLSQASSEGDFGLALTQRFAANVSISANVGFVLREKSVGYPFEGDKNGFGYGRLMVDYMPIRNLQFSVGGSLEEAQEARNFLQEKNWGRAQAGLRYFFRSENEDITERSKYSPSLGLQVWYSFDENSEDEPIGAMLSFTVEPSTQTNTQIITTSANNKGEAMILTAQANADDTATVLALTNARSTSYTWYVNGETMTTATPELTVNGDELAGTIKCEVTTENGDVLRDRLEKL